ncbi:hypothetical protein PV327_001008 [Microctonus hyperodae]|uniref:Uncharacterized protein n=1 Tax=Microctonus hyperodae TaxID=165561 RepID=A0AA39G7P3_MICHY|nr:hypothetical protein PV327_001008 [Microctonus hyperodae]
MSRRKSNSFKLKNKNESSSNIAAANLECDTTEVVDLTEEPNVYVEQGTPVRHDVSTQQDYFNYDYHSFLPQTQDGGIEVTWDWHSPGANKNIESNGRNSRTHEICNSSTPKRSTDIHKKRISNSPLMYKPLKRKLIKIEKTDEIDKFKAELIALSEKIKKGEDMENLANELEDDDKTELPRNMNFRDPHNDENDIVVCDENTEFLMQNNNSENQNFDDFFNDSLNDTMIKCSQEIEERLNIAPVKDKEREYSSTAIHNKNEKSSVPKYCYSSLTYMNKYKFDNDIATKFNSTNGRETTLIKHKSDLGMFKNVIKTTIPSSNTAPIVGQNYPTSMPNNDKIDLKSQVIDELHIPDDSFDEFLATCDEDFSHSDMDLPSTTTQYGKVYDNSHSMSLKKSNISSSIQVQAISNAPKRDPVRTNIAANMGVSNSTVQSKNLAIGLHSMSTSNRNWKFFKSKSHSDSSFATNSSKDVRSSTKSVNQIGSHNIFKGKGSSSSENSKSGSRESSSSSVSTEHQIRRTSSCLDSNAMTKKSTQKNIIYNKQMYNVNRYGAKEDGSVNSKNRIIQNAGDVASGIQSLQLCGPEEIERKRKEAKMKLEAKKKREKMHSNSDNILSRVHVKSQNNSQIIVKSESGEWSKHNNYLIVM